MYLLIQLTKTIRRIISSISPATARRGLLVVVALACFALSPTPKAFGVTPAPDGGYAGGNTAEGDGALNSLTTGILNTAIGFDALFSLTNGYGNTAMGYTALYSTVDGSYNTAIGEYALYNNTSGTFNVAVGFEAQFSNTTGNSNTAIGELALYHSTTGGGNTAIGSSALQSNTIASNNTANGFNALNSNTIGNNNTANGVSALQRNTTGPQNTATGSDALFSNTTGSNNTANGVNALLRNTTGQSNIALGVSAGANLTTGSNNIDIGAPGVAGESGKIRIGKQGTQNGTFIAGISGVAVTGSTVVVNSSGKLGVATSSARFKDEIKPMDKASEAILALKPVTFHYKQDIDPDAIPQFGLVAEDVEKINPDLVGRDENGKVNTVRYEAINAMLLNEFLKEHRKVREQEATIGGLKSAVAEQRKEIEALTVGLQKVSTQLESSSTRRSRQVVDNNL